MLWNQMFQCIHFQVFLQYILIAVNVRSSDSFCLKQNLAESQ